MIKMKDVEGREHFFANLGITVVPSLKAIKTVLGGNGGIWCAECKVFIQFLSLDIESATTFDKDVIRVRAEETLFSGCKR